MMMPRITIGAKLVSLVAILLMTSVLSLVWLTTRMFVESDTALIQQANSDTASNLATQMRELFQSTTEKMRILGNFLHESPSPQTTRTQLDLNQRFIGEFFAKDKDFLAVYLQSVAFPNNTSTITARALSPEMTALHDSNGDLTLTATQGDSDFTAAAVSMGEVQLKSIQLPDNSAAIALAIPFIQDPEHPNRFTHTLIAVMRQNKFVKAFSDSDVVTSFMVDHKGKVLAHSDPEIASAKENFSQIPIVKELLSGKFSNGQTRYLDPRTNDARLGAFRVVGFGGLGVVAEVAESKAFEGARKVVYRAALIGWIILCLSFLAGYLYSGTITWPIRRLESAAKSISSGDFNIHLKSRGRDEIAHLSQVFNEMAKGLVERDRVKETFNKFHNKEIAEKLLSGEVKLGGERKQATVFFSDVRGFTSLSETMEPEQVVEMLNEYMTRMVSIIRSYKGIVDKYVGDAIMAIWGVPISTEEDCYNAVRACLAMREDLEKLNELRLSRGQPVIKIGMGLNSGPLIAGNIGSNEKMEYTVIGDAVNLASRIESMTKEFGTDCLISKSVYEKIQHRFIFEKAADTKVKGKTEAVAIFRVLGYIDEQGKAITVETPYSSYTAEKSDKVVHDHPAPAEHHPAPYEPTHTQIPRPAPPAFEAQAPMASTTPSNDSLVDSIMQDLIAQETQEAQTQPAGAPQKPERTQFTLKKIKLG